MMEGVRILRDTFRSSFRRGTPRGKGGERVFRLEIGQDVTVGRSKRIYSV